MNVDPARWSPAKGRILMASVVGLGFLLALALLGDGQRPVSSGFVIWIVGSAFAFNLASLIARWLVTRDRRPIFLLGMYPVVLGMIKVAGLVAVFSLIIAWVVGFAVGGAFSKIGLAALVRGIVAFGLLGLIIDGLLNALIVARSFRGTLAATSRDRGR